VSVVGRAGEPPPAGGRITHARAALSFFSMTGFSLAGTLSTYASRTWDRQDIDAGTKIGLVATKTAATVGYAWGRRRPARLRGASASAVR